MSDLDALTAERETSHWWRTPDHPWTAEDQAKHRGRLLGAILGWRLPQPYTPRHHKDTPSLVEDVEWLVRSGDVWNVAARVGMDPRALDRRLRRIGRNDLANEIRS